MSNFYRHLVFLVFALALLHSLPSTAQDVSHIFRPVQTAPDALEIIDMGKVTEVLKPDLIKLDNDKRYLLDNIRVSPYFSHDVMDYLNKSLVGRNIAVFANITKKEGDKDRYGNILGHVMVDDGRWVQEDIIAKGLAWVQSSETNRDLVLPLYRNEITARENKIGMWAEPEFVVRNDLNIHAYLNTFQLFEGTVKRVSINDDVFLYFGDDPKTDFTIRIPQKKKDLFLMSAELAGQGTYWVDFLEFKGLRVRIRGWVQQNNGPMIEWSHPEQIEFPDFDKYSRAMALKSSNPPPLMPYDLEEPKDGK